MYVLLEMQSHFLFPSAEWTLEVINHAMLTVDKHIWLDLLSK